ncbi:MAG: penicillin-binding protein 2 [Candidatus Omnitrophica bacterium]|nr:penicillin-binding protein 2 [Candidatus Omnitrophota bacterium]
MTKSFKTTNQRIVGVCVAFLVLFGVLWARCLYLQLFQSRQLSRLAEAQHRIAHTLIAPRGNILDRDGRLLATTVRAPSVFANPRQVEAKAYLAHAIAPIVDRHERLLKRRLEQDKGFVWLARHADRDVVDQLVRFQREGIGIVEEPKRIYPNGPLAAHLLGFTNIDQQGLEGLELAYDGVLRGRRGWESTLRDARGRLLVGPWTRRIDPQPGSDVVLTLDSVVQGVVEEMLSWGVKEFRAKGGTIVVMDPHTGAILAIANQPAFDPNHPARVPAEARRNRAVTDLFEPGSVFKIVTAAALLEEGLVRPEERFFCENGEYRTIGRRILHDHTPHGWLTFREVIVKSSNIGTVKAAQRLTPQVFSQYIRGFGFGQKTGIELPGEVRGIVTPPERWSKLSPFNIPMGQEVAATPIQLAVMTSIVANGGWKVTPYLIQRIQTSSGEVLRDYQPSQRERLLRQETVDQLHDMLTSVVESGTGRLANIQGLTAAGKTGTAQKLEPTGRYSHSLFVASFVGYGPVPDPRFVMVVSIDEPRPLYFGGVVAAPIFKRTVEQLAGYWELYGGENRGHKHIAQL